ncbi:CBS domain protein [Paramagnetospirillum magnetotacticum MS-1]|uniref:CBS domain protein n=1 Tax=Paramagnetospirillum magnetotacticum MS-1 TaxID=272627 RepID=A0A0C2UFG1_PARME|nr:CBS domain-containing protein [Paramagnetospirillum magnetotacticum]KIM00253.1 CBS domain protein [Paramagnetospirillum magnetotacticum MS-1]
MPVRLIRDVIRDQTVLAMPAGTTVREAARQMKARRVGAVMVTDHQGRLQGIFTERDCLFRVLAEGVNPDTTTLALVMTANPVTITADRKLGHALHLMHDNGFRHIPVVDHAIPVGMISIRDALGSELSSFERERAKKSELGEILG